MDTILRITEGTILEKTEQTHTRWGCGDIIIILDQLHVITREGSQIACVGLAKLEKKCHMYHGNFQNINH